MRYLLNVLEDAGKLSSDMKEQVIDFLESNQFKPPSAAGKENKEPKKQVQSWP